VYKLQNSFNLVPSNPELLTHQYLRKADPRPEVPPSKTSMCVLIPQIYFRLSGP